MTHNDTSHLDGNGPDDSLVELRALKCLRDCQSSLISTAFSRRNDSCTPDSVLHFYTGLIFTFEPGPPTDVFQLDPTTDGVR